MPNLKIFVFQQHWFHLGSLVEAIAQNRRYYENVEVFFIFDGLSTWPLSLHFKFPFWGHLRKSPQSILTKYLYDEFNDSSVITNFVSIKKSGTNFDSEIPESFSKLRAMRIGSCQVGMAIANHLITFTRNSHPDVRKYKNLIRSCLRSFEEIKTFFQKRVADQDQIWVCNGRTFHERVVVELAKTHGNQIKYYEIGGEGQVPARWILHNESPHDRVLHQQSIVNHSLTSHSNDQLIQKWFLDRQNPTKNHFIQNQENGALKTFEKPSIVFFTSSDDEVSAISEDWDSPWGSQIECVKKLITHFAQQDKFELVIRVHPNQRFKSKSDRRSWDRIQSLHNSTVFGYESNVDSYALLDSAEAVIVFGSTLGVEAAYWRHKLAYLSHTRYDLLIPAPFIKNGLELSRWLSSLQNLNPDLILKCFQGSRDWANYMLSAGSAWSVIEIRFKNGKPSGYLHGQPLRPKAIWIALTRLTVVIHREVFERRLEGTYHYFRKLFKNLGTRKPL